MRRGWPADVQPRFSKHAREQMAERRIGVGAIVEVLTGYDSVRRDGDGNQVVLGVGEAWELEIVVKRGSVPPFIITVWPLGGVR